MGKKTGYTSYSVEGVPLVTLFLAPTKNQGLSFGFTDPKLAGVHLTVYSEIKDGRTKIHSHLTDGEGNHPWTQVVDSEFYTSILQRITGRWVVSISKVPKCWVMRSRLAKKLALLSPRAVGEQSVDILLELYHARIRLNLGNPFRWRRIDASSLPHEAPGFGVAPYRGAIRWVYPTSPPSDHVICFSDKRFSKFQDRLGRLIGFDALTDYLETKGFNPKELKPPGMAKPKRQPAL
jgi:hypothetical protein